MGLVIFFVPDAGQQVSRDGAGGQAGGIVSAYAWM